MSTKTTKRHFELFRSECLRLLAEWGVLGEWRVEFVHQYVEGCRAQYRACYVERSATLLLSTDWGGGPDDLLSDEAIRDCAQHESVHLMLAPLHCIMDERYVSEDESKQALEAVVRRVQYALDRAGG